MFAQDSLGGNTYTVMLCNCSPAAVSREETVSALRFAERAKRVENKVKVNVDPRAQQILSLLQENRALKFKVERLGEHIQRLEEHY